MARSVRRSVDSMRPGPLPMTQGSRPRANWSLWRFYSAGGCTPIGRIAAAPRARPTHNVEATGEVSTVLGRSLRLTASRSVSSTRRAQRRPFTGSKVPSGTMLQQRKPPASSSPAGWRRSAVDDQEPGLPLGIRRPTSSEHYGHSVGVSLAGTSLSSATRPGEGHAALLRGLRDPATITPLYIGKGWAASSPARAARASTWQRGSGFTLRGGGILHGYHVSQLQG